MGLITRRFLNSVPLELARYSKKTAGAVLREGARASLDESFDIFLSHSYADVTGLDENDILRIKNLLEDHGFSVYVDWVVDSELNRDEVTPATAALLRKRIEQSASLLYATSDNASKSRWMPWELGYADGEIGRVATIPIEESSRNTEKFRGEEFLGLYPYVTYSADTDGTPTLWVQVSATKYVSLRKWIDGKDPYVH